MEMAGLSSFPAYIATETHFLPICQPARYSLLALSFSLIPHNSGNMNIFS
jgi:hypothetical protein